jgi:hypothetical protein
VNDRRSAREAVFRALWADPVYIRLNAQKDKALQRWNRLDAYKNTPSGDLVELACADRAAKRACKRVTDYEDAALKAARCF